MVATQPRLVTVKGFRPTMGVLLFAQTDLLELCTVSLVMDAVIGALLSAETKPFNYYSPPRRVVVVTRTEAR